MTEAKREHVIDVNHVAHLARLDITAEEADTFQAQLEQVVDYVEKLREVDVSEVEPMRHAAATENVFREDAARPGLDHDGVMGNAPASRQGQFTVPKIVE